MPEEVRQTPEFMPIYPFERTVYPVRLPSPFLVKGAGGKAAVKGPGGIISGGTSDQAEGPGDGGDKKRSGGGNRNDGAAAAAAARNASSAPVAPSPSTPYQAAPQSTYIQPYIVQRVSGPDRSVVSAAGGLGAIGGPAQVEKLAPETGEFSLHLCSSTTYLSADWGERCFSSIFALPPLLFLLLFCFHHYLIPVLTNSFYNTAKLFDRDPDTNEVLWFAAPPINLPRAKGPRHSLAYLQFLARKRKTTQNGDGGVDGDGSETGPAKRARTAVLPTVTETTMRVLKEMAFDG